MIIYTDGSAHPNPGPGGFGVIVLDNDNNLIDTYNKQFNNKVTNNEMELKAILYSIIKYGKMNEEVDVYTDSSYAYNSFTSWMYGWHDRGWIKKDGRPPENLDLIQAYYALIQDGYKINLHLVKGHSNNLYNYLVDKLATGKMKNEEIVDFLKKI